MSQDIRPERRELYEPRCILLTGGAGFVASHVVELLLNKYPQYRIVVLDSLEYCSNLKNLQGCVQDDNRRFKFVQGDIRSKDLVRHILQTEEIDTVLHFAAQTHVDNSFGNSIHFTETNIIGTHVLLEASVLVGVSRFLHVSTDEVYGETSFTTAKSNTESGSLLAPTNPYSASKAGAEMLVMAYGTSYNLPYIITRGNNVYGPRQFPEKAIPKFINLLQSGRPMPLHGDGMSIRSFMYVSDAANAFDIILHRGKPKNIYNIGAHEERTMLDVAKDLCALFDQDPDDAIEYVRDRAFNDRRYFVDCTELSMLGWEQKVSWETGLNNTVSWYTSDVGKFYWNNFLEALEPHPSF